MIQKIISCFLLLLLFSSQLGAESSLFLMPRDADRAVDALAADLASAKKRVDVAIYSFTHKRLAKALKKAAANGAKVRVVFDEAGNLNGNRYTRLGDLAKIRGIRTYTLKGLPKPGRGYDGKMHMKLALIDGERAWFGSANWSYSAFSISYELLYATDERPIVGELGDYYETLLKRAKPYD